MACVYTGLLAVQRAHKLGKARQGTWLRGVVHGQVGRIECLQYRRAVTFQIRCRRVALRRLNSSVAGDANVASRRRGRKKGHFPDIFCGGTILITTMLSLHLCRYKLPVHAGIRLRSRHHHWLLPEITITRLRRNGTLHKISDMVSAMRVWLERMLKWRLQRFYQSGVLLRMWRQLLRVQMMWLLIR